MLGNITFSAIVARQVERTLAEEFAGEVDAGRRWRARVLLAINDILLASFA